MSELMTPLPFAQLLDRLLLEKERSDSVFGVSPLYVHEGGALSLFGEKLELPLGPAAGPHTQLAQNIVTAYCCGARFFELKTVQKMDGPELAECINRPCIKADYEGYNCEWSTELTVQQALEEYIKAWVAIKIISLIWAQGQDDGFIFNMSVGYDLEGIQSEKVNTFIDSMMDASATACFRNCLDTAAARLPEIESCIRSIDPHICRSVTVSTLHGCPPQEIESIASYLIEEKGLHTFVKCNPTLLGYETARARLDAAGYDYVSFDDHHFRTDLQWQDAIPMFRRLQSLAAGRGLEFGLKLSNTCPVDVTDNELPAEEMYMSGRPLYLLTVEMASRLTTEFKGDIRLSFSGGLDLFNIVPLFEAGIWPLTCATTLLQPGGYGRLTAMAKALSAPAYPSYTGVDELKISKLAAEATSLPRYRRSQQPQADRKIKRTAPLVDCYLAPCQEHCPLHQDAPEYLELLRQQCYEEALRLILTRNPLPFLTGTICAHRCMTACTRRHLDAAVDIRAAKLKAAETAFEQVKPHLQPPPKQGPKVAVIGGGPAGLSAAYFLGRAGLPVTIFEQNSSLGGVPRQIIPEFRISAESIDKDIELVQTMTPNVVLGQPAPTAERLRQAGFEYLLLAVGRRKKPVHLDIDGHVLQALDFLEADKAGKTPELGSHVVVIGGGNTAMDAARAAMRVPGVTGVTVVYRRTRAQMPAAEEELELALSEGVEFRELLAPVGQADGYLQCRVMRLGSKDSSGRRNPEATDEQLFLPADTVIAALGAHIDEDLLASYGHGQENAIFDQDHLFVVGDAKDGSGATIAEAIADSLQAAEAIVGLAHTYNIPVASRVPADLARERKAALGVCGEEACLACSSVCENCVSVCPNRANIVIETAIGPQVLHLDRLCNECGNCASFCPYEGGPYQDKFTLFSSDADFENSTNQGFLPINKNEPLVRVRLDDEDVILDLSLPDQLDPALTAIILAVYEQYRFLL